MGPATEEIKIATRDILANFEDILDIKFSETIDPKRQTYSVSTSSQMKIAGFSYFPNNSLKSEWMFSLLMGIKSLLRRITYQLRLRSTCA